MYLFCPMRIKYTRASAAVFDIVAVAIAAAAAVNVTTSYCYVAHAHAQALLPIYIITGDVLTE